MNERVFILLQEKKLFDLNFLKTFFFLRKKIKLFGIKKSTFGLEKFSDQLILAWRRIIFLPKDFSWCIESSWKIFFWQVINFFHVWRKRRSFYRRSESYILLTDNHSNLTLQDARISVTKFQRWKQLLSFQIMNVMLFQNKKRYILIRGVKHGQYGCFFGFFKFS